MIETVLDGRSVLAVMPTGAGKSLCYQVPAMLSDGVTLVVSPLIALMKDQVDGLPASVQRQATLVNSTLEGDEIERRLRLIGTGERRLVYAAPERLRQRPFLHALKQRGVSLFVVDEAHCVSMWGHDFRPDYLFIGQALAYLRQPPLLAMTATAGPRMRLEIADQFDRRMEFVSTGVHRPNLVLECAALRTDEDKMRDLIRLCREIDGSGIVYVRSRVKTEQLARLLRREGVRAGHYHAGLEPEERAAAHEAFMDSRTRVVCATVAFGLGIDKPDVRFVIHYSMPQSIEDYYQEAGRAGRDGEPSRCVLMCSPSDKACVTRWMRQELMDIDLPRRCYAMLRELTARSPFAAVASDDFERDLCEDETRIRVAISMLEAVGLARRHLDIPTSANVALTAAGARDGDEEFSRFARAARLKVGHRLSPEPLELAERSGVAPNEVEEKLLKWRDAGWLAYRGSGRVMLIERLPAPADSKRRLEELIARHASVQEARAARMVDYAETRRCRHEFVCGHFSEAAGGRCAACDNCAPQQQPYERVSREARPSRSTLSDEAVRRAILQTARSLSGQVGFTGLVKALKGSVSSHIKRDRCPSFGVLADRPKTTIERWVSDLLESGQLERDGGEYRLISLTRKGAAELRSGAPR